MPIAAVKLTWDLVPQKSSFPATQVSDPQDPLNTPILVSKEDPQRLKVVSVPSPAKVYQTPGAVFNVVPQVATASVVANVVEPVSVSPQLIVSAPEQRSLAGGGV